MQTCQQRRSPPYVFDVRLRLILFESGAFGVVTFVSTHQFLSIILCIRIHTGRLIIFVLRCCLSDGQLFEPTSHLIQKSVFLV